MKNLVTITLMTVLVALLSVTSLKAQNPINEQKIFSDNAIANLKAGINNENWGVRRSSIYLAGKYEVKEVMKELIEQLKYEEYAQNRILISLVLYKIGDSKGMAAVNRLSKNDDNPEVRRMCRAILEAAEIGREFSFASLNK